MKRSGTILVLLMALFAMILASCDAISQFIDSRTRKVALITIYNSNHEETNKLQPNDTLYVEVQGLKAGGFYRIECQDPEGKIITMLTAIADDEGVIGPSPLWYDVGFVKYYDESAQIYRSKLPTDTQLGLRAFNIHVVSEDTEDKGAKALTMTDFSLPFYVVFSTSVSRPEPIVMAGRMVSGEFYLENAFESGDVVYVKVANLDALPVPAPVSGKAKIYLVPFTGEYIEDGSTISHEVFSQEVMVEDLKDGVVLQGTDAYTSAVWDGTTGIPVLARGYAYSVIVDINANGIYEVKKDGTTDYYLDGIDGNGVAGFIVKKPPTPPTPDVDYIPANIASGGTMGWATHSFGYWPDYDYRNEFHANGYDTKYAYDWQSGSYGYGVKAIWNPYVNINMAHDPNSDSTLYYGRYVDVWIVESTALDLTGGDDLVAAHSGETYGTRKLTLPVQSACDNGSLQQNIWRAPMLMGEYCVVVDLDRDGKVSDGDIVDNVDKADNKQTWGFKVISNDQAYQ